MTDTTKTDRSPLLPSDPFDITLANLLGHPNGANTGLANTQSIDPYGNVTQHLVQTVRWAEGDTVFVTQVSAAGTHRFILPPKVLALIDRQRAAVALTVKRRHGQRLAEATRASGTNGAAVLQRPEVRRKAQAARKAKAAARKARREARGGK